MYRRWPSRMELVLDAVQKVQEGVEHLHLLVGPVRPEGVGLLGVALVNNRAEKVGEACVLVALGVRLATESRA